MLSLILPAYNEALRLPPYLASVRTYLDETFRQPYEVIVVDDGSCDRTAEKVEQLAAQWPQLRTLAHERNQGKGAAVRTGVVAARGDLLLFADADGATPIDEFPRLAAAIDAGADVAIGSRLMPSDEVHRARSPLRGLSGVLFASVARRLLGLSIRDTQCGFKLFRGDVGRRLFSTVREPRYLFDLELLALAQRMGCRIVEVPINWHEVAGGHLHPLRELPRIVLGLWRLRRNVGRVDNLV